MTIAFPLSKEILSSNEKANKRNYDYLKNDETWNHNEGENVIISTSVGICGWNRKIHLINERESRVAISDIKSDFKSVVAFSRKKTVYISKD